MISDDSGIRLYYGWDSSSPAQAPTRAELEIHGGVWSWQTEIDTHNDPNISAILEVSGHAWN